MNLLFVCDEYPPGPHGGIGSVVQTLARELVRQGHKIWVAGLYDYGYGGADYESDQGVEVYRLRKKSERLGISMHYNFWDKALRKALFFSGQIDREVVEGLQRMRIFIKSLVAENNIELVEIPDHQHFTRQVGKAVLFPVPETVPTVCRLHGSNTYFAVEAGITPSPVAYTIERELLQSCTAISSVSAYTARQTAAVLHLERHMTVIHNGIVVGTPATAAEKQALQVLFAGSLLPKKGIFQLMMAWNKVVIKCPEAQLNVLGKGATAPLRALLSPEAVKQVYFKGHQPHSRVIAALRQAGIAVFPSFAEAFALAPLEAMAAGTATIYSQRTSGPEIITDGLDGLILDPADTDAMAAAILQLLSNNSLREQLALAGYERVKSCFTIEKIAQDSVTYYQTLTLQ